MENDPRIDDMQEQLDSVYTERAHLVAALSKLFPASIEQHVPVEGDLWDTDWLNICVIDLPTGQASWHLALRDMHLFEHLPRDQGRVWDGHTTEEKYSRLDALTVSRPYETAEVVEAAKDLVRAMSPFYVPIHPDMRAERRLIEAVEKLEEV